MQQKRVLKIVLVVSLWAYAGATWASIGHQLFNLPDFTILAALACGLMAGLWMARAASRSASQPDRQADKPATAANSVGRV
jgi:hypothetical protein